VLGHALANIEQARAEALIAFPKAMATIRASATKSQSRSKAVLAKIATLEQKFAAMKSGVSAMAGTAVGAAAGGAALAASAKKPAAPKFDGQLGERLSSELLARVADVKPQAAVSLLDDKEIWQDWNRA
jgi:hypothetical protein